METPRQDTQKYFEQLCPQILEWIKKQNTTSWILLEGELGAGKTTLVGELLSQLGYDSSQVQSPTFLKVISYKSKSGEVALHMDAYRVEELSEFLKLGLEDYENIKIGLVEWPKKFEEFLRVYPAFRESLEIKNALRVQLPADHDFRKIKISESL